MVRKERYVGLGLDTDTSPDKRKPDTFYDSQNIEIINNGRAMSITPIKGESSVLYFPSSPNVYRDVVGTVYYNNYIYIFIHGTIAQEGGTPDKRDELFKFNTNTSTLDLIAYWQGSPTSTDNWFTSPYPTLDIVVNYETENIIKLYWIDGINQLRSINVTSYIGEITGPELNFVKEVNLESIAVSLQAGGGLTAGTIQYVYNYYNLNESQSSLSPASELISLSNFYRGFESQENTGLSVKLDFSNIDTDFDAIKIYSIHYQELNQTPLIKLIYDERVGTSTTLTIYDDGNRFVAELSLTDLLSINPLPYIPNTLAIKRERLFLGNYSSDNFNPDVDMRAYSFNNAGTSSVTRIVHNGTAENVAYADIASIAEDHDCINADWGTYKYQYNTTEYGGEGINIKYAFKYTTVVASTIPPKSFKVNETYRIGIILYNKYGQKSPVKWVADFVTPYRGFNRALGIVVQLTHTGVDNLQAANVTYYQICVVERKPEDRSIISQGFIVPACKYTINGTGTHESPYWYPYYIVKDVLKSGSDSGACIREDRRDGLDWKYAATCPYPMPAPEIQFFYSSDTIFENSITTPTKVKIVGEATRYRYTGYNSYTILQMHKDNVIEMSYDWGHAEPYWGAVDSWHNPKHVMDQTNSTGMGDTSIEVYTVAQSKYYNYITGSSTFTDPSSVITLKTTSPSSIFLASGETGILDAEDIICNSANLPSLIRVDASCLATSYKCNYAPAIVLNFDSTTWHRASGSSIDYSAFDDVADIYNDSTDTRRGLPIVDIMQDVPNQYGGNSYEAKQRNEYLPLGQLWEITTTEHTEYIGDIWRGTLSVNRTDGLDDKTNGQMGIYEHIHIDYIENNHNVYARNDTMHKYTSGSFLSQDMRYVRIADNHKLLGAYNQVPNIFTNYPTPLGYQEQEKYPMSVISSNGKIPGELLDSWLIYNPSNTKLLEGQYGTLTKLHNLNGDLLAIQTTGIAMIEVEPRIQTVDSSGMTIQLGIGSVLYNHKYLVTNSGTNRKSTICEDGKQLYYWDSNINALCSLHEGKLSTLKTVKTIVDSLTAGPHTVTFFNKKDQIYFQYTGYTLVYDLLLQKFTSKYTFLNSNKWLVPAGNTLYQLDDSGATLTVNTQFTGNYKSSYITYSMCPDPIYEKVFHNLEYRLNGTNFTSVNVTNERGSTSGTVTPDIATKFDIHRLHLPRVANSRERFRGITIYVTLNNTASFSLDDIVLMYNIKG